MYSPFYSIRNGVAKKPGWPTHHLAIGRFGGILLCAHRNGRIPVRVWVERHSSERFASFQCVMPAASELPKLEVMHALEPDCGKDFNIDVTCLIPAIHKWGGAAAAALGETSTPP